MSGRVCDSLRSLWTIKLAHASVIMLGSVVFGYTMGFGLPAVSKEGCGMRVLRPGSETFWQWFSTLTSLTAVLGPIIAAFLLNRIGRRTLFFANSVFSVIIWLLFLAVNKNSIAFSIVLRGFNGISIGIFSALAPLYLVEISPKESTGFFGSLNQLGIAIGFFLCYIISSARITWQALAGIGAIFPGLGAFLIWLVPESPAVNCDQLEYPSELRPSLTSRTSLWKLFVGTLLMLFQQTTGVNMILLFLVNATESKVVVPGATCTLDKELMYSAFASLAQVVACLFGALLIEHLGRRFVWTLSLLAISVTDAAYAATFLADEKAAQNVRLIMIFVFLLAYGLGAGPVPWFLMPEQFETPLRAYAMSIIACVNWIFAFALIYVWEQIEGYGSWVFPVFAALSLGGAIFGYFYAPNTQEAARKVQELVSPEELYQELGMDGRARQ
jgi:MFS family permease